MIHVYPNVSLCISLYPCVFRFYGKISGQNNRQRLNNCIAFFFGMQARPSLKTSSSKARSWSPSKLFHRKLAPAIPQNLRVTDFLVFDFVLSLQVCFFSVFVAFWLQVERNTSFISWFHIDCWMVSLPITKRRKRAAFRTDA